VPSGASNVDGAVYEPAGLRVTSCGSWGSNVISSSTDPNGTSNPLVLSSVLSPSV
jgi:hypothetical protein